MGSPSLHVFAHAGRLLGLLVLGLTASNAPLPAQEGDLRFDHISVEDGLSHSGVRAISQDRRGFLWLGTQEGLNRYDGYTFKVYKNDPQDPGSLSENRITAIYEDRRGELWIGTWGGGLHQFHPADDSFVAYRHDPADPQSLRHDIVSCILEDRRGVLWIGTADGLNRLHRQDGTFTGLELDPAAVEGLSGRSVAALHEDASGVLWIGTEGGLDRFDGDAATFESFRHVPSDPESLSPGIVSAIQEGPKGRLWIATAGGLDRFDSRSGGFTHFRHDPSDPRSLGEDHILSLHLDRSGELWIGTASHGLDRWDQRTGTFLHDRSDSLDPESLSDGSILSIYEDKTGLLWFGTYVGVNKYDRTREQFGTYRQRPGRDLSLSSNSVWALHEDRSGVLWVGTYDDGLNAIDRRSGSVTHYKPDSKDPGALQNGEISSLCEDHSGVLWVGTWGGLHRFDRTRGRFTHYRHDPSDPRSLSNDKVFVVFEDTTEQLWVGTQGGVNRYDRATDRLLPYPGDRDSVAQVSISSIGEDRDGALWFGSHSHGLYRLDRGSGRLVRYRHDRDDPESLSSNSVATLYEDRSGVLWIGTFGAGLNRFRDGDRRAADARFVVYRERDGLPNDSVLGILEDDRGNLWLSTNDGLSRFDPRSGTFHNFNVDDGLQGRVYTSGSSFRSPSGEMFFGGVHGFNAFFPDRITDDPHAPDVVITEFRLFNEAPRLRAVDPDSPLLKTILETKELVLSHRDYVFSFEFAALDFSSPRDNRYAYYLEGFDRDWIATSWNKRFAQYSNLAAGNYIFRVKASNSDGVWNESGAAIGIVVLPPPWRTWWAYSLYTLLLSASVVGFVRSSYRKVERERAVNRRLREADKLKDALLEERAVQIEERERLIAELEAKNAELERFTYSVSHDLKNPVVTIKGFLGLARQDAAANDGARLEHDFDRIGTAADTMQRILDELLQFFRIGSVVGALKEVSLSELAREGLALVESEVALRGVEVVIHPDLPVALGDRDRLREVFQNLIGNAASFMGDEEKPRVEVGAREEGEQVVCYVRDNGVGIEAQYHEKVFGLFERLNVDQEGTGIGLALVKRIVEGHGGRIWIESEGQGRGSTFCFTLPRPAGGT